MLGEMERFNENLVYIVRAIDLLVKNNVLKVSGNSVYYLNSDKDFSSHRYKIETLIQLCGYVAFMELLISEKRYPVIPLLIFDHISKDFSEDNQRSLGPILNYMVKENNNFQIIMFDDKFSNELGLEVSNETELDIPGVKTGFNPFI